MKLRTILRTVALAGGLGSLSLPVLLPATLAAQERGIGVQRVVHGVVMQKGGGAVKGAIVYLRDTRTSQVKTAFTDDAGNYRFVQLSESTDYELWAQTTDNKERSKTKTLSSFDSKKDITMGLQVE